MSLAHRVLAVNDDLPIRSAQPVHSGKVRAVYWLSEHDSARLVAQRGYNVAPDAPLAVMVISDRISAYEVIWRGEGGLEGVPGKGAALNGIASHWFGLFKQRGLAASHILEVPHPLVWIVQKAQPVLIEAIARQYITGSMWRAYAAGERSFCGAQLPEALARDSRLPELLITPSTKSVMEGLEGIPALDDVNVSRDDLLRHSAAFGLRDPADVALYERLLRDGFELIASELASLGQIFVDTKFEFGYVTDAVGDTQLIYMDEVGTPDSSRIWDAAAYQQGRVIEHSKEFFRQKLLAHFPDPDILTNKARMAERPGLAQSELPISVMMETAEVYLELAQQITGASIAVSEDPRAEIIDALAGDLDLIH
ncbi:MAG: phosphoribosylaminoimidazolesuccinocarboxamide synthase [Pseudomonadota bacterium]